MKTTLVEKAALPHAISICFHSSHGCLVLCPGFIWCNVPVLTASFRIATLHPLSKHQRWVIGQVAQCKPVKHTVPAAVCSRSSTVHAAKCTPLRHEAAFVRAVERDLTSKAKEWFWCVRLRNDQTAAWQPPNSWGQYWLSHKTVLVALNRINPIQRHRVAPKPWQSSYSSKFSPKSQFQFVQHGQRSRSDKSHWAIPICSSRALLAASNIKIIIAVLGNGWRRTSMWHRITSNNISITTHLWILNFLY